MRTFVLFARKARTDSDFNLKDLAGSGGKMDTVCRFIRASLWISHGMRRDTDVYLVLNGPSNPPVTIRFIGESLKRVDPNERGLAIWIMKALDLINGKVIKKYAPVGKSKRALILKKSKDWHKLQEGIEVSRKSFQEIIKSLSERPLYVLEEKGERIEEVEIEENPVFILGDSIGMPKKEEKFCLRYGEKISIGKQKYFASACCTILNYILDGKGI